MEKHEIKPALEILAHDEKEVLKRKLIATLELELYDLYYRPMPHKSEVRFYVVHWNRRNYFKNKFLKKFDDIEHEACSKVPGDIDTWLEHYLSPSDYTHTIEVCL